MILLGGGSHQKDHKRSYGGGRGVHQKITEDHDHKEGGGGACKRIDQTEGANKENNYSHDQLSMGGSRGDIFIDQY